ncbi:MAG: type II and III secretion system protein [Sedimentisphaerales bacterium]|nr:type II and III secretion system protein [Sedimentisphaerales bacterium]
MTGTVGSGKTARLSVKNLFFWTATGVCLAAVISGCGDFFASKPTEIESMNLLRELETVKPSPTADISLPEVYREPPKIMETLVGDKKDARLFYFSRYHTVDKLKALIDQQYMKIFQVGKQQLPKPDYNVAINAGTNQMIVRCPSVEDAQEVLKFLERVDVPPIQVRIDCLISEVYADHTLDWETRINIENLFGEGIELSGYMPGAALRDAARNGFGMDVGYEDRDAKPGHEFNTMVDLLVSRGYLKILMNPSLEVVNGETARINTSDHVRLDTVQDILPTGYIKTATRYVDIVDSLEITPRVFADGFIGIKTRALIGSKATPEGVTQSPIITTREINVDENRVRPGQSLVIGGIRKTEQRSVVRGVPFLKDLPFVGILFSSKDFEERGKEVLFILTPTISTGGIPNEDMVAEIQRKHTPVRDRSFMEHLVDPLGSNIYTELVEEEATNAEVRRTRAEMQRLAAERKAKELEEELAKISGQADQAAQRATQAQAETEAVKGAIEEQKAKAAAAQQEKEKLAAEVQKLTEAAQAARTEADKAKQEAAAAKAAADKAKKDAEAEIDKWMKQAEEKSKEAGTPAPAEKPADKEAEKTKS